MPWSTSADSTLKRSAARRRGAVNMDYVFGAALAAVIVGALALTIYYGFGKKTTAVGSKVDPETHFKCDKCGEQWTLPTASIGPGTIPRGPYGNLPMNCPKCSAKSSSYLMTRCPQCQELYVSDKARHPENKDAREVCPSCGTDREDWYAKNGPK